MERLERAARILSAAHHVCVLTGAGISAESGIPTFRGPGGYWRGRNFMELATPEAFARDPRLVWDWYLERRRTARGCEPNAAHRALAEWSRRAAGVLITQNVDGLHERAGHLGVVRFHGSLWRNRCLGCGTEREAGDLEYPDLPHSPCCSALERPGVVWFGEQIPGEALDAAERAMLECDAVLVVGTSAVVQPAAGIAAGARACGAQVVVVNLDETPLEADVVLRMKAAEAVPRILGVQAEHRLG